jgi:hypothetical protein
MTRKQRADALLTLADWWQRSAANPTQGVWEAELREDIWEHLPCYVMEWAAGPLDIWASYALSEVCALGYDIEGAEVWDREKKEWRPST